jgi:hypothetical protein
VSQNEGVGAPDSSRQFHALSVDEKAKYVQEAAFSRARARAFEDQYGPLGVTASIECDDYSALPTLWGLGSWEPDFAISESLLDQRRSEATGFLRSKAALWESKGETVMPDEAFVLEATDDPCSRHALLCIRSLPDPIFRSAAEFLAVIVSIVAPHGVDIDVCKKVLVQITVEGQIGIFVLATSFRKGPGFSGEFMIFEKVAGELGDDGSLENGAKLEARIVEVEGVRHPSIVTETELSVCIAEKFPDAQLVYRVYEYIWNRRALVLGKVSPVGDVLLAT